MISKWISFSPFHLVLCQLNRSSLFDSTLLRQCSLNLILKERGLFKRQNLSTHCRKIIDSKNKIYLLDKVLSINRIISSPFESAIFVPGKAKNTGISLDTARLFNDVRCKKRYTQNDEVIV